MKFLFSILAASFISTTVFAADIVLAEQFFGKVYQASPRGYAENEIRFLETKSKGEKDYYTCEFARRDLGTTTVSKTSNCVWRIVYDGISIRDVSSIEKAGFQAMEVWLNDNLDMHYFDGSFNRTGDSIEWIANESLYGNPTTPRSERSYLVNESALGI